MIRRFGKQALTAFCSLVVLTAATLPAQAGIVTDAWHAVFGPPGSPWFPGLTPGYYSTYYGGSGYYTGYYRSRARLGYYRAYSYGGYSCCQPVTYCDPCGTSAGNCAVSYGSRTSQIEPKAQSNGAVPKTYKQNGTQQSTHPGEGDSNFEKKEAPGFGPTRDSEKGNTEGTGLEAFETPTEVEAKKVTTESDVPETVIKQRKPAPSEPPDESEKKAAPADGTDQKKNETRVEPLNLDRKIVWHSTPKRTRLRIHSRLVTPLVARTKVDPNRDWTPVPQAAKLASN